MSNLNRFLLSLPHENRRLLYSGFGTCMHIVMLAFLIIQARRTGLNGKNVFRLLVSYYVAFFMGTTACNVLGELTNSLIPRINLGVAFLVFLLVHSLLTWLLKANARLFLDIAVPVFILGRGIGIIGCLFPGCCHGFPVSWGIYSHNAGTTVVPTVLIDMLASYLIVAYLLFAARKLHAPGMLAAKGILLFGALRYTVDVLRDNHKVFSMVSVEGVCGVLYVLIGLILWYIYDSRTGHRELTMRES